MHQPCQLVSRCHITSGCCPEVSQSEKTVSTGFLALSACSQKHRSAPLLHSQGKPHTLLEDTYQSELAAAEDGESLDEKQTDNATAL